MPPRWGLATVNLVRQNSQILEYLKPAAQEYSHVWGMTAYQERSIIRYHTHTEIAEWGCLNRTVLLPPEFQRYKLEDTTERPVFSCFLCVFSNFAYSELCSGRSSVVVSM